MSTEKRARMNSHTQPSLNEFGQPTKTSVLEISDDFLKSQTGCEAIVPSWKIILTDAEIQLCVDRVALHLNAQFANSKKPIVLTAILKGTAEFGTKIPSVYFLEASSYGHGQQQSEVRLLNQIDSKKFIGRQVILLDELFDNGTTLNSVRDLLIGDSSLQLTPADVFTCTLFTKKSGTTATPPNLVGIYDLPPLWLVGYGLDDQGEKRGWPHLFACPKLPEIPKEPEDQIFDAGESGLTAMTDMRRTIVASLETIRKELLA